MSASEEGLRLAALVIEGLTRLRTTAPDELDIDVLMHPDDIKEVGQGSLWGKSIREAYWVKRGHPHLEVTVIL